MNSYQLKELNKCRDDIVYFVENYTNIYNTTDNTRIKLTKSQQRILRRAFIHTKYALKGCRQFGKSTLTCLLALHTLLFGSDERIVVVSSNSESSRLLAEVFDGMYEFLPMWLGRRMEHQGKSTKGYGGNILNFVSATSSAVRGVKPTTLILDEFAHFDNDFILSVFPVVALSKINVKILSTPRSRDDFFENLYNAAHLGLNSYVTDIVTWRDNENLDETWRYEAKIALGDKVFAIEWECQV
jgi:hypothetical protein